MILRHPATADIATGEGPVIRRRVPLLDVVVTPYRVEELLLRIGRAVTARRRLLVAGHNLHSVHLCHQDRWLREFYEDCDVVLVDGMPVLAALNLGDLTRGRSLSGPQRRLGSTDWIDHCAALAPVRRIALLGASADSNAAAAAALESTPVHAPDCLSLPADPWQPERLPEIAAQISAFAPDVLLIGMGMPLQERVAAQLAQLTDVPVIAAVGGAIDQISGAQPLAPRWLGRLGLEWLFRLLSDPRRLAHRYLVEPVLLRKTLAARKARP